MSRALVTLAALGVGCGTLLDPDDCRQSDGSECEVYRPGGLLCGLVSRPIVGTRLGSLCNGSDPTSEDGSFSACYDPDPTDGEDLYVIGAIDEHEGSIAWHFCQAVDNAERSSADLDEVPRGAACGFNSTHRVDTNWTCLGVDPIRHGGCPDGFGLRYAIDVYNDCPTSQPPVPDPLQCQRPADLPVQVTLDAGCADNAPKPSLGHLVVWCERTTDARSVRTYPDDFVCGLHGNNESSPSDPLFWRRLRWEELDAPMCATMTAEYEAQRTRAASCLGVDVASDGCPDGMIRACVQDAHGSSEGAYYNMEALCWCTTGEPVIE